MNKSSQISSDANLGLNHSPTAQDDMRRPMKLRSPRNLVARVGGYVLALGDSGGGGRVGSDGGTRGGHIRLKEGWRGNYGRGE